MTDQDKTHFSPVPAVSRIGDYDESYDERLNAEAATPPQAAAPAPDVRAAEVAGEPALTTCNCRWTGEELVQQCTLHEAWRDAIHDWAERAKEAERKLAVPVPVGAAHCTAGLPCKVVVKPDRFEVSMRGGGRATLWRETAEEVLTDEQERALFEKEHDVLKLDRHPTHGYYLSSLTQAYWEGWVARADVARAAPENKPEATCGSGPDEKGNAA